MTEPTIEEVTERETMRLAGISTAAIGYWKVGDSIHPDYDTQALRDVAELYQKYDKLYKEIAAIRNQPVEPLTFDHFTNSDHCEDFGPVTEGRYVLKTDYDALQSALQVAQQERNAAGREELRLRYELGQAESRNKRLAELLKEPSEDYMKEATRYAAGALDNVEQISRQFWNIATTSILREVDNGQ